MIVFVSTTLLVLTTLALIAVITNYENKSKTRDQRIHYRLVALQEERQFEDDLGNL